MKENIKTTTLKSNLCIGCGICAASCPFGAITMQVGKEDYKKPIVNEEKCTHCGICVQNCPHTFEKVISEAKKVATYHDYEDFGVQGACGYYLVNVKDEQKRLKSASGGACSYIAEYLLKNHLIDVIVHAEMIEGTTGEQHYQACLSTTVSELIERKKSFYCAISFDKVLKEIEEKEYQKVLIIGTPCVIRGLKNYLEPKKNIKKVYSIALACSHNVNGMFTDYLADTLNINRKEKYKVDLRNKDEIKDANQFNNHYFTSQKTLKKMNRFESEFTKQWRNYSFSMNICNSCSDFWGYTADISVKDAWGKWSKDPLGKSIVIVRNPELQDIFKNNKELNVEKLTIDEVIKSQIATIFFKQFYAIARSEVTNPKKLNKISLQHRINAYMRKYSIHQYQKMKHEKFNNAISKMADKISIVNKITVKIMGFKRKLYHFGGLKQRSITKEIKREKRIQQNKILVVGGYGYQNAGDEAQLNVVIKRLEKIFPNDMIRVLSPNVNYTLKEHNHHNVAEAPRVAFFHEGESILYRIGNGKGKSIIYKLANSLLKILFLLKSSWIQINAILVKHRIPTFLLGGQASGLLYEIQTAKMVYFEGGGYLTGKTLSRLWDGILLCKLAKIYEVPVVMSGQTIGVLNTKFNKHYTKSGFKNVKLITLRDPEASIKALKEIGIQGKHIYAVCDDALFCEKEENEDKIEKVLEESECIDIARKKEYVAFNMHYWGLIKEEEKKELLNKMNRIISYILNQSNYNIILIPMVPGDEKTMNDYMNQYPSDRIGMIHYDYNFRTIRKVISDAKICVTMKHHPIIFSAGELVPVIALNLSDYYEHKNGGALQILGIAKYSIVLSQENYQDKFQDLWKEINSNYEELTEQMENNLQKLKDKTEKFEQDLQKIIK